MKLDEFTRELFQLVALASATGSHSPTADPDPQEYKEYSRRAREQFDLLRQKFATMTGEQVPPENNY